MGSRACLDDGLRVAREMIRVCFWRMAKDYVVLELTTALSLALKMVIRLHRDNIWILYTLPS